jgi:hypothetical protein
MRLSSSRDLASPDATEKAFFIMRISRVSPIL